MTGIPPLASIALCAAGPLFAGNPYVAKQIRQPSIPGKHFFTLLFYITHGSKNLNQSIKSGLDQPWKPKMGVPAGEIGGEGVKCKDFFRCSNLFV